MTQKYKTGTKVRIKHINPGGTHRTPDYIKGKSGVVTETHGTVSGYEIDHREDWGPLYTVIFDTEEISGVQSKDRVFVDVHEDWLEVPT